MTHFFNFAQILNSALSPNRGIEIQHITSTILCSTLFLLPLETIGQQEKLEIDGAIQISNSEDPIPDPGTVQWSGSDLEVYDGTRWLSLTGDKRIRDIDNNSYEIVTIGTQVWMAQNLRTTRYNDGTFIPLVTDNTEWSTLNTPAYTWYNDDQPPSHVGAMYNYYTVADTNNRNICPIGWHVPTTAEWQILRDSLGGQSLAGGKMKQTGLANWNNPNTGATNESGFSGISGGFRAPAGSYSNLGFGGHWWSSSASSETFAIAMRIDHNDTDAHIQNTQKGFGLSVRCVKD